MNAPMPAFAPVTMISLPWRLLATGTSSLRQLTCLKGLKGAMLRLVINEEGRKAGVGDR